MADTVLVSADDLDLLTFVAAWISAYPKLAGSLPRHKSEARSSFLADLERDVLSGTTFAVKGIDIVLRSDLASRQVVETPVRVTLGGLEKFREVSKKYEEALVELEAGKPMDAAVALELMLEAVGHQGKTLGDQLRAARKAGLLSGIDTLLGEAIDRIAFWVTSVRNQKSDSHAAAQASQRDGELLARVAGSLLLWLAAEES